MGVDEQESAPVAQPGQSVKPGQSAQQLSRQGTVAAVSCNEVYSFTKPVRDEIVLVAGLGVAGDVHAGVTVRHRSRVAVDPDQPNLRQVHLIRSELHDELREAGYDVPAGGLGENVTTTGLDLLDLPVGTILRFGPRSAEESAVSPDPAFDATSTPAARLASASAPVGESAVVGPTEGAAAVVAAAQRANLDAATADAVAALSARIAADGDLGSAGRAAGDPGSVGHGVGDPGSVGRGVGDLGTAGRGVGDFGSAERVPGGFGPSGRAAGEAGSAGGPGAAEAQIPGPARSLDPRPAIVITGLRNPCQQINRYRSGLLKRVLVREADGSVSRRAGVMGVVLRGGPIRPGAKIEVEFPALPHRPLDRV